MDTHRDLSPPKAAEAPRQLLPVEAYTSDEWFRREQKRLFAHAWVFAGMVEDVPEPGSYKVVETGAASLILLRDTGGTLRAFHNSCRHRGARLLEGEGKLGRRLTCFYHRWSYELDGRLAAVTFEEDQFVGLDKSCLGLFPAGVGTWKNMVFVNPDPGAQPFGEWLGDTPERMGPHIPGQGGAFDPERLVEVSNILYRVQANWKVIAENFIDGYHLPLLHPVSLGDGDFFPQRWTASGKHIVFYRPLKPGIAHDKLPLPVVDGIPPTFGAAYYWLFPGVAIYETATSWATFHVIPVSAGESLVHSRARAMPEALDRAPLPAGTAPELPRHIVSAKGPFAGIRAASWTDHPLQSNNVMLEDIYACEAVQKGLSSPAAQIGPLSRWESTLPFFQQHILDALA